MHAIDPIRLDTHGGRYVEGLDVAQSYAVLEQSFGVGAGLVEITLLITIGGVRRDRDLRLPRGGIDPDLESLLHSRVGGRRRRQTIRECARLSGSPGQFAQHRSGGDGGADLAQKSTPTRAFLRRNLGSVRLGRSDLVFAYVHMVRYLR